MSDKWPSNVRDFCASLGIEHPIIQAPMAGGPTTPELIAAVSNAGGLGSMGAGYLPPDVLDGDIKKVKSLTDRPFSVNLFVPKESKQKPPSDEVMNILRDYSSALNIDPPSIKDSDPGFTFDDQLDVIIENGVQVFSFTFGVPEERHFKELLERGIKVLGTATCVDEGAVLENAGCTGVTAQGSEAGGHRATFSESEGNPMIGEMALLPQLSDNLSIPVIASGGIMDGRGIAAAFSLGASAVQLGTAFLGCREAGVSELWLSALINSQDTGTALTNAFTGKYARGLRNKFIEEMSGFENVSGSYPLQHYLTKSLRAAAKSMNDPEYQSLWAGQGAPMVRRTNAKELVQRLVQETREVIAALSQ